jgi:hypothetical protein
MTRKNFRIGDRVSFRNRVIGVVDYHLHDNKVLVRETTGLVRCYPIDALELAEPRRQDDDDDDEEDEPAPACPTPAKLQEAIEIIEGLMSRKRGGATLVRLHALVASSLDDFFLDESDTAVPFPDDEIVGELIRSDPPF